MTKLKELLNEISDGTKIGKRLMKKFKLSQYDVSILCLIANGEKIFMDFNLLPVLNYLKIAYVIDEDNINFNICES